MALCFELRTIASPKLFLKQAGKEIPYALPFVSEAHTSWKVRKWYLYTPELKTPGILTNSCLFKGWRKKKGEFEILIAVH